MRSGTHSVRRWIAGDAAVEADPGIAHTDAAAAWTGAGPGARRGAGGPAPVRGNAGPAFTALTTHRPSTVVFLWATFPLEVPQSLKQESCLKSMAGFWVSSHTPITPGIVQTF